MILAGFGTADMTPKPGTLTSLFIGRPLERIVTPLQAKICLIGTGELSTAIVSLDTTSLYSCVIEDIRRTVAAVTGTAPDKIIVVSTHTHSSPYLHRAGQDYLEQKQLRFLDSDYYESVLRSVEKAALDALAELGPVDVHSSSGVVSEVACNRRVPLPDGSIGIRFGRGVSDELRGYPDGLIDPEVQCLWFADKSGQIVGSLVNYACHATSFNQFYDICWDYPGFATEDIERKIGGISLFLQGCAGNISPGKYTVGEPLEDCRSMGRRVADAAHGSFRSAKPVRAEALLYASETVPSELRIFHDKDELVRMLDAEIAQCRNDDDFLSVPSESRSANILTLMERIVLLDRYPDLSMPSEVTAIGFGDVRMVFLPGESFIQSALQLKTKFSHLHLMVMAYTDSSLEYVPNAEAYEEIGGYETGEKWCFAAKGTAERLLRTAEELVDSLA
ncbi:hypothetical protein ACFFNY_13025 [Paenibacillus hodogayensis]|uniref:Neutral/alkaline non-lysosomal ceramidase N-terminal domain-containing protein n=1 Tax=Paenibacillus hodogayensis TaxID=279208 RepID=A0ABV5VWZ3_9BACL